MIIVGINKEKPMRSTILILFVMLTLSACGANYRYQTENNPQQWQGQNISVVQKQWGMADQVMHARNGQSYYVYSAQSGSNMFRTTTTNFGSGYNTMYPAGTNYTNTMSMDCTTMFTTTNTGMITKVWHKGNNCGGEWVKRTKPV
jgi:hypothetical protein